MMKRSKRSSNIVPVNYFEDPDFDNENVYSQDSDKDYLYRESDKSSESISYVSNLEDGKIENLLIVQTQIQSDLKRIILLVRVLYIFVLFIIMLIYYKI